MLYVFQKVCRFYSDFSYLFRCSGEESLETRCSLLKKQTSNVNKTTKVYLTQKISEKTTGLQPEKSRNLKSSNKNPDFKNKPASLKSSLKCGTIITTNKTFEKNLKSNDKNLKSNDKNKLAACKANMKPNSADNRITKTFNKNINTTNKKALSSSETKIISNSVEDKKENLPSPIYNSFEQEIRTPQRNQIASKQECFSARKYKFSKICSDIFLSFLL